MRSLALGLAIFDLAAAVSCPVDNGKTIGNYQVACGINHSGGDMPAPNGATTLSIEACVASCAARSGCVVVAWLPGPKNCYMKSTVGAAKSQPGVWSALKVVEVSDNAGSNSSASTAHTKASSATSAKASVVVPAATSSISSASSFIRNAGKRGLVYNDAKYTSFFSRTGQDSRVSWAYNWYSTAYKVDGTKYTGPSRAGTSELYTNNPALTYIPMLWSDNVNLTRAWQMNAEEAFDDGADAALDFNEPDQCGGGGSCMTISKAVAAYKVYFSKVNSYWKAGKMGAPALTNSGSDKAGLRYLQDFMKQCSGCTIDFVPIHWYSSAYATQYFKDHVTSAYELSGHKPLYITEFGFNEGDEAQQIKALKEILVWLDQQPFVERYAYFMASPGSLINGDGSGLSELGKVYNSYNG